MRNRLRALGGYIVVLMLLMIVADAVGDVSLPAVIGDNMVLQQKAKVAFWGWADPGEKVHVKGSWQWFGTTTQADAQGSWRVALKTPKAGGPYKVTVKAANTIELSNVLVGEVWICSGQSNMYMPVKYLHAGYRGVLNYEEEIAGANYPSIRFFQVPIKVADEPLKDCQANWLECSPETVGDFSGTGYSFGKMLHGELGVPVGLIQSAYGATRAQAWTRREALEADPDFAGILERFAQAVAQFPQAQKEYQEKLKAWTEATEQAKAQGKPVTRKPVPPLGPGHRNTPGGLYNAMIAPLVPFTIKGAIWYQGEGNAGAAYQYRKLFPTMIQNWRDDWGLGDFSFLFVQLASFQKPPAKPSESRWAELREAQLMTLSLPNTAMAVAIDLGEVKSIHPRNKQEVGRRLALAALAQDYGRDVVYSGPIYQSMKIEGNKIHLSFEHVHGGLVSREGMLRHFTIAGDDRKFVNAQAEIDGDTVWVYSDDVASPVAVRYAWAMNPEGCNLYNDAGLPASPFRTDNWPGVTANVK